MLETPEFTSQLFETPPSAPTLAHGQRPETTGFYIMEAPTDHWVETLTGLGATGIEMVLVHTGERPVQGHPLVAVLQVASEESVASGYGEDLDLVLTGDPGGWSEQALDLLIATAGRQHVPKVVEQRNIDFQLTRGLLGVST